MPTKPMLSTFSRVVVPAAASAGLIQQKPPFGFVASENRDYDNYRSFYRTTWVRPPAH